MEILKGAVMGELGYLVYELYQDGLSKFKLADVLVNTPQAQWASVKSSFSGGSYSNIMKTLLPLIAGGAVYYFDPQILSTLPLWGSAMSGGFLAGIAVQYY